MIKLSIAIVGALLVAAILYRRKIILNSRTKDDTRFEPFDYSTDRIEFFRRKPDE